MKRTERPVRGPTQANRAGYDIVEFINCDHTLQDQMAALPKNRALQPVGDKSLDFLARNAWNFANAFVKGHGVSNGTRCGSLSTDALHQRYQVRGIKRMANQERARICHLRRC